MRAGRARAGASLLATLSAVAPAAAAEPRADPRVDYMLHCQGCHLADGSGSPGAVPRLRGQIARFLEVPGGRAFLVQVPGSASSALDDAGLAAVLNWMIREFGPPEGERAPPSFRPYDAAEVARYRATPLLEVERVRKELLALMEAR